LQEAVIGAMLQNYKCSGPGIRACE